MKKVLMVAAVPSMIGQFNMSNIRILQELGYEVGVACNFKDKSVWTEERVRQFIDELEAKKIKYYQIDFSRNPIAIDKDFVSYQQLKRLIVDENIELIHCHTPVAGVISRMVTHKMKVKVIYTAHGFHFFDGAPKKNWLIYYPIEKFFSKWTDVLITINKEDYNRAKKNFYAKVVRYIPGVGVDTKKFANCNINRAEKQKELCIPEDAFVLLSVGELQNRKNQRTIIEALHKLKNQNIYYLVVGKGKLQAEYEKIINKYGLEENIRLLGFRTDIDELCKIADCFVHPSVREGLGIAPLEAMASGLPLISSYINGIKDYTKDDISGCCIKNPVDVNEMSKAIDKMFKNLEFRKLCGTNNIETAKKFDITNTEKQMRNIYKNLQV